MYVDLLETVPLVGTIQLTISVHLCIDWSYCTVARQMLQMAASNKDLTTWNGFQWRRKHESFGSKDETVAAVGASGEVDGIW